MTKIANHEIVLAALLALGACAKDDAPPRDAEPPASGVAVGDQVFPSVASTTEYETWGLGKHDRALQRGTTTDLALGFAGKPTSGERVEINVGVGGAGQRQRLAMVLPDGRPSIRPGLPAGAVDILELLPEPGTRLELHKSFDTAGPDADYILGEADHDRMVLWQQVAQTPTQIVAVGDKTLVRLEGRGINRVHFVDDDGSLRSADMGTAYLNVTDLVNVPGQGWQVLRFARLSEVDGADQNPDMSLADARGRAHSTFIVCASRMDIAGRDLALLHGTGHDEVPEFASCK